MGLFCAVRSINYVNEDYKNHIRLIPVTRPDGNRLSNNAIVGTVDLYSSVCFMLVTLKLTEQKKHPL